MRKVLVAAPVHEVLLEGLKDFGYECFIYEKITQLQAHELVDDCVGIITSTRLLIDKELMDAAPKLEWVGRMGSGMEIIDLEYAAVRNIHCFSSPEGNRNAVAEHALGMLLALNKKLFKSSNEVRQGHWLREENRGHELEGKTVGIIGFGNTGSAFARKLSVFDVNILAYDLYSQGGAPDYVKKVTSLEEIYEHADIVSFHVPLQKDTFFYCNETFINNMQKPFILVNTSRGKVVDTKAMYDAFFDGKITGVCLDVWEEEPIEAMSATLKKYLHEMAETDRAIITPHIAGYSFEALYKMSKTLLDKIVMQQ